MAPPLQKHQKVRIKAIPPDVEANRERNPDTYELVSRMVGNTYTIRDFNIHGFPEFWLKDNDARESIRISDHCIWLEPDFVEVVDPS